MPGQLPYLCLFRQTLLKCSLLARALQRVFTRAFSTAFSERLSLTRLVLDDAGPLSQSVDVLACRRALACVGGLTMGIWRPDNGLWWPDNGLWRPVDV